MLASLLYMPTGHYDAEFKKMIAECNVDPKTVKLKYAFTNEMCAMAVFDTIIIDPIVSSSVSEDPEALKVKDIFQASIKPSMTETQKNRIHLVEQALSPAALRFIFKHELGHVMSNYSPKKLGVLFLASFLAAYCAITSASAVMQFGGIVAIFTGLLAGFVGDLLFTYASNLSFKAYEEKKADQFAAQFSSRADIQAAADFFERHQEIIDTHQEPGNYLAFLPSIIVSGHPHGTTRASYLRAIAAEKVETA